MTTVTRRRWAGVKYTRRNLLRTGAAALGGAAATGALGAAASPAAGSSAAPAAAAAAPPAQKATLLRTLAKGAAGAGGYRPVITAAGEAHTLRTELGAAAAPGRASVRTPVIAFAQLSDVHIVDAQSPMRLEFTDRLDDSPIPPTLFSSSYRPHEFLSGQIANAMVREINAIGSGPVTGAPLALAIQTGDNSDNSQLNEVRWNIDLLNGGTVRVDSGNLNKYEGVADGNSPYYDPAYYHPHGTPAFKTDDVYRKRYGFPVVPGLLDAARRPFQADGLDMPWYSAFGNHDGLVQGNFPQLLPLSLVSTGALKIMSLPAGLSPAELVNSLMDGNLMDVLRSVALTPAVRLVTPDLNRRFLTRKQVVDQHFSGNGATGHGFTAENRKDCTAYYTFDQGDCRFIVLDTVNPNGFSDGSIDNAQFAWLQRVLDQSAGKVVMVFSHHTSWTMKNTLIATGGVVETRVNGSRVLERLLEHDEVVAWINGHTHKNQVVAHARPGGTGGLWEINTASHIDWPQQSRLIEIADNQDGTLSIFTTMVDHSGPTSYGGDLNDPIALAGLGRELAANDPQNRTDSGRGQQGDRNVELLIQKPF